MNALQKLISLLTKHSEDLSFRQQMIYTGTDRMATLGSVKLVLTKGIFLSSLSDEESRRELFLFYGSYIEIRLQRSAETSIQIRMLSSTGRELEDYLEQIGLEDLRLVS